MAYQSYNAFNLILNQIVLKTKAPWVNENQIKIIELI